MGKKKRKVAKAAARPAMFCGLETVVLRNRQEEQLVVANQTRERVEGF